ncbi:MAG: hypothetical protein IIB38_00400 [Candidatus Hydrogenedentes bacterium]|nr:hypothetical protein [Candidatus Hydrogenedentota bacterium]
MTTKTRIRPFWIADSDKAILKKIGNDFLRKEVRAEQEEEVLDLLREFVRLGRCYKAKFLNVTSEIYTLLVNKIEREKEKWGEDLEPYSDDWLPPEENARKKGIRLMQLPVVPDCEKLELVF